MVEEIDHVEQGVATAMPLGDSIVHFGVGHSYARKKQGVRRVTFRERRAELEANPPTEDKAKEI